MTCSECGRAPAVVRIRVTAAGTDALLDELTACESCAAPFLEPWLRWQERPFRRTPGTSSLDTRQKVDRLLTPPS